MCDMLRPTGIWRLSYLSSPVVLLGSISSFLNSCLCDVIFRLLIILLSLLWIRSGLLISLKIQHSKQGALFLNFWIWNSGPRFATWFGGVSRIDNLWQFKRPEGRVPDPFEEWLTDWGGREGFLRDDGCVEFWRVWQAEGKSKCDALQERGRRSRKKVQEGGQEPPHSCFWETD